jgi:hypothetical protein
MWFQEGLTPPDGGHIISLSQIDYWHDDGGGIITWAPYPDGTFGWKLGFVTDYDYRNLRLHMDDLLESLAAALRSATLPSSHRPHRRNPFRDTTGNARTALVSQLNAVTVDIPLPGLGTLHIGIRVDLDSIDHIQAFLRQPQVNETDIYFLRTTLSPTTTWHSIPSDYGVFRLMHYILAFHRIGRALGVINYLSIPKDRAQLANHLDTLLNAFGTNLSHDQGVLQTAATTLCPILRTPKVTQHISDRGHFLQAPERSDPDDTLSYIINVMDVFSPRQEKPVFFFFEK